MVDTVKSFGQITQVSTTDGACLKPTKNMEREDLTESTVGILNEMEPPTHNANLRIACVWLYQAILNRLIQFDNKNH